MIKINLALRKQIASEETSGSKAFGVSLGKMDLDQLKGLPIRKLAVPAVIALLASYYVEDFKETELKKFDLTVQKFHAEGEKLKAEVAKFKSYDSVKTELDGDEVTIKAKLETIKKLTEQRGETTRTIGTIAKVIPPNVWLTELKMKKPALTIKGGTAEFHEISDFMRVLSESTIFSNVELKSGQQAHKHADAKEGEGEGASFELSAVRR